MDISIIIPLNNEEENVRLLYLKLAKVLKTTGKTYEIIFVDDGSNDSTYQNLCKIYEEDSNINIIRLTKRFGQSEALAAGFDFARGDVIITMDGDLQHDPADIPRFLEKIHMGYDMVSGRKNRRTDNVFTRRIPSLVVNGFVRLIFKIDLQDVSSTYRAYRKEIAKNIKIHRGLHRFIPILLDREKPAISEIDISYTRRKYGKSHYNFARIGEVIADIFLLCAGNFRKQLCSLKTIYSIKEIKSSREDV